MWFPTTSADSITRPRIAVAIVSAVAAVSVGYYAYQQNLYSGLDSVPGQGLHRSNAVRRNRRSRRRDSNSSSSSEAAGDENAEVNNDLRPLDDWETVVDDGTGAGEEWWEEPDNLPSQRAGQNIVNLLFRVSEDNAKRSGCVHRGCQCNSCGMLPIRGIRYRCANCADFDLCETCESQGVHTKTHIFYKIRVPAPPFGPRKMQPVWYTGDPDTCLRNLPRALINKLSRETGFERPDLEAFWEQWTFMANAEWRDDPDELFLAMDRKTFERCLVPTGGSRHAAPNLIHDRMFAFYDYNKDGYIGFTEFLHGLSYRKRRDKLRRVFEGYDIDGDGLVSRRDFLRMFRAYYVLYKQMHKDILDGLEDQLLASTEAQQLVASRQPLSSLFGREGRVPNGDRGLRLDGKTLHRDGNVDVAPDVGVVADDRGDTSSRQDILTSLFAYDAEPQSRFRLVARARNHSEDYDQRMRSMQVTDADRPYLVTLIDPPTTLDDLPDAVMGNHSLDVDDDLDVEREDSDEEGAVDDMADILNSASNERDLTETDARIRTLAYSRKRIPRLEKRRRDMARAKLHERWKRRQFYLDEEEGGEAPYDWRSNEDIFLEEQHTGDSSKSADHNPVSPRSRSSSKVRFVDDMEEFEIRSNPSTSSRSIPERWGATEVPEAEKDAGKEILYQVTQQAFNELLDTIFKPSEDLAVQAKETKELRERFKDRIAAYVPVEDREPDDGEPEEPSERRDPQPDNRPPSEKTLNELLSETGYSVAEDADAIPRNAVDLSNEANPTMITSEEQSNASSEPHEPTLPQFRPNSMTWEEAYTQTDRKFYPVTNPESESEPEVEPNDYDLARWQRLNRAEKEAAERGGWGKLSYDEFEEIYRSQEYRGNRLDYLGSWIDFCIP